MKTIYKYLLSLAIALMAGALWSGCSKDDFGKPSISYIRITNPNASDSLVVGSVINNNQMIAIIGQNLQSTREVWFNDQKAQLTSTYITPTAVLVRVPTILPHEITNKMKMVFANGESLTYDFTVSVGKPSVSYLKNEYAFDGDTALIYGSGFYGDTSTVKAWFVGAGNSSIAAKTLSLSADGALLTVKVPTGAQPGPITVSTLYGQEPSGLWFRDNRNIILSFDNMSGPNGQGTANGSLWHPVAGDFDYATSSAPGVPSINGKYLYCPFGPTGYAAWGWSEIWTGNQPAPELSGLKNIPQEAFVNPAAYSLKFEVNTIGGSLAGAWFNIWIGNNIGGAANRGPDNGKANAGLYTWQPNIDTKGAWQTVVIPWDQFTAYASKPGYAFKYSPDGYDISIVLQGPNSASVKYLAFDNMRVVPNKK